MKAVHLETDDRRLIEAAKRNSNGDEAVEASLLHHLFVCPKCAKQAKNSFYEKK